MAENGTGTLTFSFSQMINGDPTSASLWASGCAGEFLCLRQPVRAWAQGIEALIVLHGSSSEDKSGPDYSLLGAFGWRHDHEVFCWGGSG